MTTGIATRSALPRLPPELCDYVLDCLAVLPCQPELERTRALVACTTVCRDWSPRAQMHLYHSVRVETRQQTLALASRLIAQPTLASIIRHVLATPSRAVPTAFQYIPLLSLIPRCPLLEHLTITDTNWSRFYLLASTARIGSLGTSVKHLDLHRVQFLRLDDLLGLIRSFTSLVMLSIISPRFPPRAITEATIIQLYEQQSCWAPATLRALEIRPRSPDTPPFMGLLGETIEQLTIEVLMRDVDVDVGDFYAFLPFRLRAYQDLTAFHVVLKPQFRQATDATGVPTPPDYREIYRPAHRYFLDLLLAIRSPTLKSLSLTLAPPSSGHDDHGTLENADTPGGTRYYHTRRGLLDLVLDDATHETLVEHPAYRNLVRFELVVEENARAHDAAWWECEMTQRLPGLRAGVIRATANCREWIISARVFVLADSVKTILARTVPTAPMNVFGK